MSLAPNTYTWLIPDRLAIAERPGGGGRSHRVLRRELELEWWAEQGIDTIVSGMRTRHGLLEAALHGFRVVWLPLTDTGLAAGAVAELVETVAAILDEPGRAVLVHVDRPGEWLAALDAVLRLRFALAQTMVDAVVQTTRDGLPFGPLSARLAGCADHDLAAALRAAEPVAA